MGEETETVAVVTNFVSVSFVKEDGTELTDREILQCLMVKVLAIEGIVQKFANVLEALSSNPMASMLLGPNGRGI